MTPRRRPWPLLLAALVLSLGAGCSSDSRTMGHSADNSAAAGTRRGASMMGGMPQGYHSSELTCSAPASLSGSTVTVMVGDMGMTSMMRGVAPMGDRMMLRAAPATVAAGPVSFVVDNRGWRTHEMVVLPLASGQAAGQRAPGQDGRVDEAGSLGEASASCAGGTGEGIGSGAVGWVTLTLPAGRYELLCNLPNHYADGMYQELLVS